MDRINKKSNASKRIHQVYIQSKTLSADGRGGFVDTWADSVGPIWASVDPIRAVKRQEYKTTNVISTHLIGMSAKITVTEHNRIRFGNRVFEIETIEDILERGIDLVITASEVRA